MSPDIVTYFYITIGGIILLLISHIVAIYIYRNHIKKYELNQNVFITSHLAILEDKLSQHQSALDAEFASLKKDHDFVLDGLKVSNSKYLDTQEDAFKKHTDALRLNYSTYVTKVDTVNEQLSKILAKLNSGIDNYKDLSETLRLSYKKLELLSDKTKELQADHERLISEHENQFGDMLKSIRETAQEKLIQLSADGEVNFIKLKNNAEMSLESFSKSSLEQIQLLMSNESFSQFTNNVAQMNKRFDDRISDVKSQLSDINKLFTEFTSKLDESNGKSFWSRLKGK